MIRRVSSEDELFRLPKRGVEAQKIRALLNAYGANYDFCRFFVSDFYILCEMNGSFVVSEIAENGDVDELADFFTFGGFSEIFCAEKLGERLETRLCCNAKKVNLMRFCGEAECAEIEKSPLLDDVYEILKTAFDIGYESWYADMSHRIRHNVAAARRLGNSALIIQYDLNGEALLSQIVTAPGSRNKGNATRLISAVCGELSPSEVFVICEDSLKDFYRKIGFELAEFKAILTAKK